MSFPTRKLLKDVLCPDYDTCTLSPCLFNHDKPAPPPPPPAASSSSVPQKRPGGAGAQPGRPSKVVRTVDGAIAPARPAAVGPAQAAARLEARRAAAPPILSAAKPLPTNTNPPRVASTAGLAHTPSPTRQKLLTALYDQFLLNYAALPDPARLSLASLHALNQELALYNRSNKQTYRNAVISALARLKKRPPAQRVEDCGTLEDDAERAKKLEEEEKGKLTKERIEKFVSTKEVLEKFDYVVEVPAGRGGDAPTEEGNVRMCDRCGTEFVVKAELEESEKTPCQFHFGRQITEKIGGVKHRVWSCCPSPNAPTCQSGPHVFRDSDVAVLHSRIPFIRTGLISTASPSSPALPIIALDCELVYTTSGMALARLTVIDHNLVVVLDEHVRPQGTVLDLNTRFSGVKEEDVESSVLDAKGVRDKLGELIDEDTIMVGHGLENDMKAMRIVHLRVIDTAIIFPHPNGGTWRHALRNLTREHLGKFIQDGHSGHSAVEDSEAALELVRYKMKQTAGR